MSQQYLLDSIPCDKYDLLSKEEVITLHMGEQKIRIALQKENEELKKQLELKFIGNIDGSIEEAIKQNDLLPYYN